MFGKALVLCQLSHFLVSSNMDRLYLKKKKRKNKKEKEKASVCSASQNLLCFVMWNNIVDLYPAAARSQTPSKLHREHEKHHTFIYLIIGLFGLTRFPWGG